MDKRLKVALFPNAYKDKNLNNTKVIIDKLIDLEILVLIHKDYKLIPNNDYMCVYDNIDELILNCDLAITIGGDGTIIHFAKYVSMFEKPVLGVNIGRLGFVAGIEMSQLNKFSHILNENYKIQERAMLEVSVKQKDSEKTFIALNDAVISRGALSRVIDLAIYTDSNKICDYRADGIIIATPTGSTAYSLSAGGPIIEPTVDCMIITPICSHSIFARPIIFDNKSTLDIRATSREDLEIFLTIDGDEIINVTQADFINIKISDRKAKIVNLDERSFYRKISEKFSNRS